MNLHFLYADLLKASALNERLASNLVLLRLKYVCIGICKFFKHIFSKIVQEKIQNFVKKLFQNACEIFAFPI